MTYTPSTEIWERQLKGEKRVPVTMDQPHYGYWRVKKWKPGTSSMEMRKAPHGHEPLAFFDWNGRVVCRIGNHTTIEDHAALCERWNMVTKGEAISYDEYKVWMTDGKWLTTPKGHDAAGPDMATVSEAIQPDTPVETVGGDGRTVSKSDNQPPEQSAYEKAVEFLDTKARDIAAWLKSIKAVSNTEQLEKAQQHINLLTTVHNRLETARETEKKPHLEAGRAVDSKYKVLQQRAVSLRDDVKAAARDFAIAEDERIAKEKAEADELARLEAAKAEEAAEAAEIARLRSDDAEAERQEKAAAVAQESAAAAVAAPARLSVGTTGKKITVGVNVTAQILNYEEALAFFKDDDQIKARVQQRANAVVKAGGTVPGCKRHEAKKI